MADGKVKLACWLYGRKHRAEFGAARPLEGNAAYMGPDEKYWWGYKYYCGPIEEPEPGSGLEERFRGQDLSFSPPPPFAETSSMTLCAGGDMLAHPGLNPETTKALWDEVRDFYFTGDLAYANLETPIAPSRPGSYIPPSILQESYLNNTPEMFERITEGGKAVGLFSTANNHCLDQGVEGLLETLDFLDSKGYPHVGTSRSPEERDRPLIVERKGIRLGFVSYTFGLNTKGLPEGKEHLANYVRLNKPDADISLIARQVAAARAEGADAVIALLHWSLEFEAFPASNVVAMAHRVIELGVDVIVGNHPHNVQPIEKYAYMDGATGERREGLILYALGDLLSIHRTLPDSRLAMLARIRISKGKLGDTERALVTGLGILPIYLYVKGKPDAVEDYRVLDFRALAGELRSGVDRYGLGRSRSRELFRLEALMHRLLEPALEASAKAYEYLR